MSSGKIYVVEHLDPELEQWSALEYKCIAEESAKVGSRFLLSSVPEALNLPSNLQGARGLEVERRSVETIFADKKERVCLLDPAAKKELRPEDAETFDVFLFGGILGMIELMKFNVYRLIISQVMIPLEVWIFGSLNNDDHMLILCTRSHI